MRIVIGSAGRRVYLVLWFQEALRNAGLDGQVYVFENDKNAASVAVADGYVHMPRYEDPAYRPTLLSAIERIQPQLFLTLNDYELVRLARGLADDIRERGVIVPSLSLDAHSVVADKYNMWKTLDDAGIETPYTTLLSDRAGVERIMAETSQVILKDRFGSGSSGLHRVESQDLMRWIEGRSSNPFDIDLGFLKPEEVVAQPALSGQEYGLDIVTPLESGPVVGILARRKLAMRHGETQVAETVAAEEFKSLASAVVDVLKPQGLIDIDVIQTQPDHYQVIDINPRFGGGYPFNHVAGADVPSYYIASLEGDDSGVDWCDYKHGYRAAKYEELVDFVSS